jgi:hypothetical protein
MADHLVKRTLERDVLPYLVSARQLRKQWFYRLHTLFGYTTDLVVALAAIGISSPLFRLLGSTGSTSDAAGSPPTLASVLASVPLALVYPTAGLILAWVVFRVAFNREDGQKRAVLARSCTQVLRQAEASLPTALATADPMPALNEMLEKRIRPTVDRNIQDNSWPWVPFAPSIDADVTKEVTALCSRYEADWAPVNALLRQAPAPENKP